MLLVISSATAFAMAMVWPSRDSRTPRRRPSMAGRMPIFGRLPCSRFAGGSVFMPLTFAMTGTSCVRAGTVETSSGLVLEVPALQESSFRLAVQYWPSRRSDAISGRSRASSLSDFSPIPWAKGKITTLPV